jgi:uncharacterized protein YkwD
MTISSVRPALLLLITAIFAAGCSDLPSGPESPALNVTAPAVGALESQVLLLIADHRASLGCAPLAWDAGLAGVALLHSTDMSNRGFFGHVDPDGRGLTDRLRAAQVPFTQAAENLARGFSEGDANRVVAAWLASPDHRRNIENCSYRRTGLAVHGSYWTHLFAI